VRRDHRRGGTARPVVADVCEGDSVAAMFETTGPLDILVNNAGSGVRSWADGALLVPFIETDPADWDPVLRVNLAGVLHVTRAYLPAMIERRWGGSSSSSPTRDAAASAARSSTAPRKRPRWASRAASPPKVGRDGVTVNCISLGSMKHAGLADAIAADPALETKLARNYPVGRLGRVDDPAPLAVLLCSDAAEWITGQVYPVDGGYAPAL